MSNSFTQRDVEQGIYVDFEGTQNDPPVMLGTLWTTPDGSDHCEQLVFEDLLHSACDAKSFSKDLGSCIQVESLEVAFLRVLDLSSSLGVPVFAWSYRESEVLESSNLNATEKTELRKRLKNALPPSRRWVRKTYGPTILPVDNRGKRYTLDNFSKLTGFQIPRLYGPGNSASRVREVMSQIELRGDYSNITPVAKRKWSSFLEHNKYDLRATKHILKHVTQIGAPNPVLPVL